MPLCHPDYADSYLSRVTIQQVVKGAIASPYELHMIIVVGIGEGLGWPEANGAQQNRDYSICFHRNESVRLIQQALGDPIQSITISTISTVASFVLLLVSCDYIV